MLRLLMLIRSRESEIRGTHSSFHFPQAIAPSWNLAAMRFRSWAAHSSASSPEVAFPSGAGRRRAMRAWPMR